MHPNEAMRLEYLRALEILDTPSEVAYDSLVDAAARLLGTPIALLSLVDADRQWFKARQGLEVGETGRELSFCAHAILDHRVMVVEDAAQDERFADNALVTGEPHIRFYAGMPIEPRHGLPLGTLCVIDTVPRRMVPEQLRVLEALARRLGAAIEGRRLAREVVETDRALREACAGLSRHALGLQSPV